MVAHPCGCPVVPVRPVIPALGTHKGRPYNPTGNVGVIRGLDISDTLNSVAWDGPARVRRSKVRPEGNDTVTLPAGRNYSVYDEKPESV